VKRVLTIVKSVVAAAVLLSPAPVLAQDGPPAPPPGADQPTPQQVVKHCLRHLASITGNSLEVMRTATGRTIEVVADLDGNGAPAPAIIRAGGVGKARVERTLHVGTHAINQEAERCLRVLRELGAPPEAAGRILEARQRSLEALREGAVRSVGAITRAVRAAIGADAPGAQTDAA